MKPIVLPKRNYNNYKLEIENSKFYKLSDLDIDDFLEIEYAIVNEKIKRQVIVKVSEIENTLISNFELNSHKVTIFMRRHVPDHFQVFLDDKDIFFTLFDLKSEKEKLIEFMKDYFIELEKFIPIMEKSVRSFHDKSFQSIVDIQFSQMIDNDIKGE